MTEYDPKEYLGLLIKSD